MFLQNSNLYMDGVEVIKGDVYQYASLPAAMQKWWGVRRSAVCVCSSLTSQSSDPVHLPLCTHRPAYDCAVTSCSVQLGTQMY